MATIRVSPSFACKSALLVMGGSATAAQILIIRELIVTFYGSELTIGIILANWLLLEAAGSYWSRKGAEHSARHALFFALLQVGVGLGCILSILFIRSFKYILHLSTGEILSVPYMAVISFLALAPVALPDGVLFTLGCKGLFNFSRKRDAAARVYLYQAAGSFAAALGFVFYLIAWRNTIDLALIIMIVSCCSAACYLLATGFGGWARRAVAVVLLLALSALLLGGGAWLHGVSSRLLWYEHDLRETGNSVYANIAVISREGQQTFFANGIPYATVPQPSAFLEEIVHIPLLFHRNPKEVLVIGGGAGGFLNEALRHPVVSIDYTEQDPLIISCFEKFATPLTEHELHHEKVHLHDVEGRLFLRKTAKRYDVILVSLPMPSTLLLNRYYTAEFFRQAREHLREDGLISITLPGSETFLGQELKELNQTLYATMKTVFPRIRIVPGDENIFLASVREDLENISLKTLTGRLSDRGITGGLMTPWYLQYKTDQERFGPFAQEIRRGEGEKTNHDQHPVSVLESMILLNMITSPAFADFLAILENIPLPLSLAAVCMVMLTVIACQWRSGKAVYITSAIISTGFTGMFMNMILILAFQMYYGYVYHYIGLLTSLFMLGLACGSFFAMKRSGDGLVPCEAALVVHAFLVYAFFAAEPEGLLVSASIIFALTFFSGVLTGAEYPIAVRLVNQRGGSVSITAGKLYAADLLGAFFGAILTAVVLLPAMGIQNALLLVAALKGGSLAASFIGGKKGQRSA